MAFNFSLHPCTRFMAAITQLDKQTASHLEAEQVITDLPAVVKELVENSLDASATIIGNFYFEFIFYFALDLQFWGYGVDRISLEDNGCGLSYSDMETIGIKYPRAISKLFQLLLDSPPLKSTPRRTWRPARVTGFEEKPSIPSPCYPKG